MALALDASTPSAVTSTGNGSGTITSTTASFTPPANSVLVVCLCTQATGVSETASAFTATDNLAVHLTYTQVGHFGNSANDVQVTVWTAPVSTSQAMTVSASYSASATADVSRLLRVLVFTGASSTTPIGANGGGRGRTSNISGTAAQYNATSNGSWGWLVYADWSASGVPTVPAGEAVDASLNVSGQVSYATIKNSSTTSTAGTQVTLSTSTPSSGLQLTWMYFELLPASGGGGGTVQQTLMLMGCGS